MLATFALGFPWATFDPFLFCVHHDDAYPAGNDELGPPPASLAGRNLGMDFEPREGWRMYHGELVPGFPRHPHRGFETVTLARRGYIDHADSLGARARFGHGDCQWMTAGRGIVHSEMFPLLHRDAPNRTELFQIWLNLPAADKLVEPHFSMLWANQIPRPRFVDEGGRATQVAIVAGAIAEHRPSPPPPSSWAARPEAEVAIWTVRMEPGASWRLPAASPGLNRTLYFFAGDSIRMLGPTPGRPPVLELDEHAGVRVRSDAELRLENGAREAELLLLQGRPIAEPVAHHGPFVMSSQAELRQAFVDYRRDGFGGWPWASEGPVHGPEPRRFAIHADGREEQAAGAAGED